jgi:hypothetical protein
MIESRHGPRATGKDSCGASTQDYPARQLRLAATLKAPHVILNTTHVTQRPILCPLVKCYPRIPGRLPPVNNTTTPEKQLVNEQRIEIVRQLEVWLELPMLVLSFVWLALLVIELTWSISR